MHDRAIATATGSAGGGSGSGSSGGSGPGSPRSPRAMGTPPPQSPVGTPKGTLTAAAAAASSGGGGGPLQLPLPPLLPVALSEEVLGVFTDVYQTLRALAGFEGGGMAGLEAIVTTFKVSGG